MKPQGNPERIHLGDEITTTSWGLMRCQEIHSSHIITNLHKNFARQILSLLFINEWPTHKTYVNYPRSARSLDGQGLNYIFSWTNFCRNWFLLGCNRTLYRDWEHTGTFTNGFCEWLEPGHISIEYSGTNFCLDSHLSDKLAGNTDLPFGCFHTLSSCVLNNTLSSIRRWWFSCV